MSLLHCACTKARVSDSPSANKPFDRSIYTPLGDDRGDVTARSEASSSDSFSSTTAMLEFESDASCYELYSVIGKGHQDTATISLAKHLTSGATIAIKRTDLEANDLDLNLLQREIVLCKQLQHEKILPHYKNFIHGQELWSIMPLMAFGSSRDLVHAFFTIGLPEQAIAYILRDTLLALEYLHNRGIIHRGIKASHILISAAGKVCLSGLQTAIFMMQDGKRLRVVHDYPENAIEHLQWFSPEILEQNLSGYDTKSDIYSLGITACELANGQAPFTDMPVTQMLLEKLNGTKPMLADSTTVGNFVTEDAISESDGARADDANRPEKVFFERTFSQHFHNFVSLCVERDIEQRPTATSLLNHPLFKNLRRKTSEALPALLHPVTPLTDISKLPKDNSPCLI
ncbi:STE20-related kinase adapter protein alpha-like isoform X1 [Haliotis rubra]|uniref:STE20-related kinase adapter protein alpha-like isoform X1 n=2 Tax=Haliotis rubra TaxID=36100 RepID=UPI001EE504D8|nr:STE20-related kinase adapter protein alpha-like isoform X1 [Haliotis rubra]